MKTSRTHARRARQLAMPFGTRGLKSINVFLAALLVTWFCLPQAAVQSAWGAEDAQTVTVTYYSDRPSRHGIDNREAYCMDRVLTGPAVGTKLSSWKPGGAALDYVLYHSTGGPDEKWPWQLARWVIWCLVAGDTSPLYDTVLGCPNTQEEKDRITAAYNESLAYEKSGGGGPEAGCSRVYDAPDAQHQRMAVCMAYGTIRLVKQSADSLMTDGNSCYSLEGARYGIYADSGCSNKVGELKTDESGVAKSAKIAAGTYWLKEIAASSGYALDPRPIKVTVAGGQADASVAEAPQYNPLELVLSKVDYETQLPYPIEQASLAGAQFRVRHFGNGSQDTSGDPLRTWIFKSDAQGRVLLTDDPAYFVRGDALYKSGDKAVFPLGTYEIVEIAAPRGYLLPAQDDRSDNDAPIIRTVTAQGSSQEVRTYNAPTGQTALKEQVVRGDLELKKTDGASSAQLAHVVFELTALGTGEQHYFATDANGYFSTSSSYAAHSKQTNACDAAITQGEDGETSVDESAVSERVGTWFGTDANGGHASVDDSVGALPFGTYQLAELRCQANQGRTLVTRTITIDENKWTVDIGTLIDNPLEIRTSAKDKADEDSYVDGQATIVDEVTYTGLVPGSSYTLEGQLMDKSTGEAVAGCAPVTKQFTPASSAGAETVELPIDTDALGDAVDVVVFERLTDAQGALVAFHEDIEDEGQTVSVVRVETSARDGSDNDQIIDGSTREASIIDTVSYRNLKPGDEYEVEGTLHDKVTGEALVDASGKAITAHASFTPQEPSGEVAIEFTFDARDVAGKTVVAFESLLKDGRQIAAHADLEDEEQTVRIVQVHTFASDKESGDKRISGTSTSAVLVDEVSYFNLDPQTKYLIEGTLMDKATGKPALDADGNEVTASKAFSPEDVDGIVTLDFKIDPRLYAGTSLVAFERVSREEDGAVIGSHEDIDSDEQTVIIVGTGTTAGDATDDDHELLPGQDAIIVDHIAYQGLEPGIEYLVRGTLMDKNSGKALVIDDRQVEGQARFVPNSADGNVDVSFEFDASKASGKDLVAFEELVRSDKPDSIVAEHKDIQSASQTVSVKQGPAPSEPQAPLTPAVHTTSGFYGKTGATIAALLLPAALLAGAAVATHAVQRRRRRCENAEATIARGFGRQ